MIYFLQRDNGDIKIGHTGNYPQRLAVLEKEHGPLKLLGWQIGGYEEEVVLHREFAGSRKDGEWFCNHLGVYTHACNQRQDAPPAPQYSTANMLVEKANHAALKLWKRKLKVSKMDDVISYLLERADKSIYDMAAKLIELQEEVEDDE